MMAPASVKGPPGPPPRSRLRHASHGAIEDLRPITDQPQIVDSGEIEIAGDEDRDELALVLVQSRRDIDRLLGRDRRRVAAGALRRADLDVGIRELASGDLATIGDDRQEEGTAKALPEMRIDRAVEP